MKVESLEVAYSTFCKAVDKFQYELRHDESIRNHPENRNIEAILSSSIPSLPEFLRITSKIEKLLK